MNRYLIIVFALMSFACGRNARIEGELSAASSFIRTRPDSALNIIQRIDRSDISRHSTRARYSLLYSQALDKNCIDVDDDSLMRVAYKYYDRHRCSDSVKFLSIYYYGCVSQNALDYTTAIGYFLKAIPYAERAGQSDFLGLVYTRIAEIYAEQMNHDEMLAYSLKAYDEFRKTGNPVYIDNALIGIANAYDKKKDHDSAEPKYREALESARRRGDVVTQSICLSNLASLFVVKEDFENAKKMIGEYRKIMPGELSTYEYQVLFVVYLDEHKIDSARYCYEKIREAASDLRDETFAAYLRYDIESAAGDRDAADEAVAEYSALSDSLVGITLQQSATVAERNFYQEQTAFAAYKLKVRSRTEIAAGILVLLVLVFTVYYFRARVRRVRERTAQYMAAVEDIRNSKDVILAQLAHRQNTEARLKELVSSRFEMLDRLGRSFYERNTTKAQQEAIYKDVRKIIDDLSTDTATKQELENVVDTLNDGVIAKMRLQLPKFRDADFELLCYIYAGFSSQVISLLTGESLTNIYTRKSRLKSRIVSSNAPDTALFLSKLS